MFRGLRPLALGVVLLLTTAAIAAAASANRPPRFLAGAVTVVWDNKYDVIHGAPAVVSSAANIKLARGAVDPDGDRLTYRWTASNGKIKGNGLRARWVRVMRGPDNPKPGVVTVTALDGHGGKAVRKFVF